MHGSPNWQAHEIFKRSGINKIGTSKHAAKSIARENRENIDTKGKSANWHQIGKKLGVYSFRTADNYRDVWRYALSFARENFQIRDIEKLTGEAVAAYLQSKIDAGIAHATFMQYAAAIEKLETALNLYSEKFTRGKEYHFSDAIKNVRKNAQGLTRFNLSRAYYNPRAIIEMLTGDNKMVARLQLEAGLRIKETNLIKIKDLLPNNEMTVTDGKGGKIRVVALSADLYQQLQAAISKNNGVFAYNENKYRYALKKATEVTGQKYTGRSTHGLRWNYAQAKMMELQVEKGRTRSLSKISDDLGHNRADITEHYLG